MIRTASFEKIYERPLQTVVIATTHLQREGSDMAHNFSLEEETDCSGSKGNIKAGGMMGVIVVCAMSTSCRAVLICGVDISDWRYVRSLEHTLLI
jgi:hypothetical protein